MGKCSVRSLIPKEMPVGVTNQEYKSIKQHCIIKQKVLLQADTVKHVILTTSVSYIGIIKNLDRNRPYVWNGQCEFLGYIYIYI